MKLRSTFLTAVTLLTNFLLGPNPLEAEVDSFKAMGMGWTGVAYPQDSLAGAYNPAGMAWIGNRFDIGIAGKRYDGETIISGDIINNVPLPVNGTFDPFETKNYGYGSAGYNANFLYFDTHFSIGLMGYEKFSFHTRYDNPFFILGTSDLEMSYSNYIVAPVIAFQIENHSIGGAINFNYAHVNVKGLQTLASDGISTHPNDFTNQGGDNSWGISGSIGWLWNVNPCFSIGLMYTPQTSMKKFTRYKGFLADDGKVDSPQIIAGGIAVRPFPQLIFTFDIENKKWRRVPAFGNNGEPALINAILMDETSDFGRSFGPGFGWRNQTALKFGVAWNFWDCFTVRAGYRFRNKPVSTSQTFLNMLTMETITNTATVGASFEWCAFEITAYYAHGFEGKVNGREDSIPTFFGSGRVTLRSSLDEAGIALGWNW